MKRKQVRRMSDYALADGLVATAIELHTAEKVVLRRVKYTLGIGMPVATIAGVVTPWLLNYLESNTVLWFIASYVFILMVFLIWFIRGHKSMRHAMRLTANCEIMRQELDSRVRPQHAIQVYRE